MNAVNFNIRCVFRKLYVSRKYDIQCENERKSHTH